MRPRFKILDKTFNTRAKDMTGLKKASRAQSRIPEWDSEKRYEFKDVWEENMEIPDVNWDTDWRAPRTTEGVTITTSSTSGSITIVEMDYEPSDTVVIHSPYLYYPVDTGSTMGATY